MCFVQSWLIGTWGDIVKVSASSLIFSVFKYIDMLRLVLWSPDASEGG